MFTQKSCEKAVYQIYDGDANGNHEVDDEEIVAYTRQGGKCPKCGKMIAENCQMQCADCYRRKSDV